MIVINSQSGLSEVYIGEDKVSEVYVGANKVWPTALHAKALLSTASSSRTIDCNSSSILTQNEVGGMAVANTLTSVEIGDCVETVGQYAFLVNTNQSACTLTSLTIADSVKEFGDYAFNGNFALTTLNLPNGLLRIGSNALTSIGVESITIPNSVTTIGDYLLASCINLLNVTIGSGVTSIGMEAFFRCSELREVTVLAPTPPTLGRYAFDNVTRITAIYVPSASVEAYKTANEWSRFANMIQPIG